MVLKCCYVFFFKQKTAYAMRISDWSSDVCSSDLLEVASDAKQAIRCFEPYFDKDDGQQYAWATYLVPKSCENQVVELLQAIQSKVPHYGTDREKIGRASCRERVCQYV